MSALLSSLPGFWGFAAAALGLILSAVSVVWVSTHRSRVLLARVEADRATRMYELETARQKLHLDAQLERDIMLAEARQPEIPFPFHRRIERPQIAPPETEAA